MYVFLQYFDSVGWIFWPVKTVARITYIVLEETLNPAQSIKQQLDITLSIIDHNWRDSGISVSNTV